MKRMLEINEKKVQLGIVEVNWRQQSWKYIYIYILADWKSLFSADAEHKMDLSPPTWKKDAKYSETLKRLSFPGGDGNGLYCLLEG